jgi:stage IV sporulation protein FB
MSDTLTWSPISLGRWFGTSVRVHITLLLFLGMRLLWAAVTPTPPGALHSLFVQTLCWLGLLLLALALHELGHAVMANWLDSDQDDVHVWPLGTLVGPTFTPRPAENFLVALAGPVTSGALFLGCAAFISFYWHAQPVWNPFGNSEGLDSGAPTLQKEFATPLSPLWLVGWFDYLNLVLLVANVIPALPFDGGRMMRAFLASTSAVSSRDNIVAPHLARGVALIVAAVGLFRLVFLPRMDGLTLIGIAVLIEYLVRTESRILEDGGYFDDGVFGYDFSEGYTSLESSAPKVRPYRESALERWRRRRSDLRRQRRMDRELAEERRMDEILAKIHHEGRNALSDEENRFLVRVSTRLRNRTKNS